jgi:ATP-dependent RNA helicase RhlE
VHRIGRTGRAGATGSSISFCDAEEKAYLKDIQKLIGKSVPVAIDNPFPMNGNHVVAPPQGNNRPVQRPQQRQQQQHQQPRRDFKRKQSSNTAPKKSNSGNASRKPSRDWLSMPGEKNY